MLIQRFVLFLGFPTYALSVVLFTLLVSTGFGAYLSTRGATLPRIRFLVSLAVACLLIAASVCCLEPLLRELIDLPFTVRVVCTIVVLTPMGLALGMAMPIGLQRLQGLYPDGVAWAWGVNGVASVVASVLSIAVAINLGFQVTTLLALACYLGALADVLLGRWPSGHGVEPGPEPAEPVETPRERVPASASAMAARRGQPQPGDAT